MTDTASPPNPDTDPDVRAIYDVVFTHYRQDDYEIVQEVMAALAAAGRLLPPGSDCEEEWTMRYRVNGGDPQLGEEGGHVFGDRAEAERHIKFWGRHYPDLTYSEVVYLRRDTITTPWVELDENTPEGEHP